MAAVVGRMIRQVLADVNDERGVFDIYVYVNRHREGVVSSVDYEVECVCDFDADGRLVGVEVIGIPINETEEEEEEEELIS